MPSPNLTALARVALLAPWLLLFQSDSKTQPDFARDVAPVLKAKCGGCHGADGPAAGLRLDTPEGVLRAVVAGKSASSVLIARLRGKGGKSRMPMGFAPLPEEQIKKIEAWIDAGAKVGSGKARHWSYIPPVRAATPAVKDASWVRNPIDSFVLARLEQMGMHRSPEAPKEVLARRLSLDLTGLPPAVEDLDRFLQDKRPDAYERLVDRLLGSPAYGEHMALKWLDLARYADTNGYEKDLPRSMWPWRDWVIKAFNQNKPFDQFTIEQLAGDLLPNPTTDQRIATGFHRNSMLNDEGGIDPEEFRVVALLDRVDTTATTWLGSTLACAQCHDHKYDPFSQEEYYRFFAFLNQTKDNGRDATPLLRLPSKDQQKVLDDLDRQIRSAKGRQNLLSYVVTALPGRWQTPEPTAKAEGATLTVLPDRSILASGPDPAADRYMVTLPVEGAVAGIRIEAIPDPSLPERSSGRNFNGNFVLQRIHGSVVTEDGTQVPLVFEGARADFTQGGHDPNAVIGDGDALGWAIAGYEPKNRVWHALSAALRVPVVTFSPAHLQLVIEHQTRFPNHNLGRFRVSITSDPSLARRVPPTADVHELLEAPRGSLTKQQEERVRVYLVASSPDGAVLQQKIERLERERAALLEKAPSVMVLEAVDKPRPNQILKRGDFRNPGQAVTPGVPHILGTLQGQDRLALAKWLVSPENPLSARVEVNRLWEQCFGQGLVRTPEDFGSQGEPPTHPELLDYLATELIRRKWDLKAMLKLIVTSSTYRQSSKLTPELARKDPNNLLLARSSRRRLSAEGVRDAALAASGLLYRKVGGPSVMPPQPPGIWENSFSFYDTKERWHDAEGPNRYRRGMYTYWRRTAPYPMALTFDMKSRDMCIATRARTNSPLQALNTLNDPTFVEAAGSLARVMRARGITYGFRACTGRTPSTPEVAALQSLLGTSRAHLGKTPNEAKALLRAARCEGEDLSLAPWIAVANTLLNLDETITRE